MTAVRVAPSTVRALRARGDADAIVVTVAAPQAGLDDVSRVGEVVDKLVDAVARS